MAGAEQNDPHRMTRRGFLGLGRRMSMDALQQSGALAIVPGTPASAAADTSLIPIGLVGQVAALAPGAVSTDFAGRGQFYLVRVAEGVLALDRRCPGQGCAVLWRAGLPALPSDRQRGWPEGQFVCLAHGAQFDRYGTPAPGDGAITDAMVRLLITEREGVLAVQLGGAAAGMSSPVFPLPTQPDTASS